MFPARLQPGQITNAKTLFNPQKPNWKNVEKVDEALKKTNGAVNQRQNDFVLVLY